MNNIREVLHFTLESLGSLDINYECNVVVAMDKLGVCSFNHV